MLASNQNWLIGNSVEQAQWESGNSSVSFPFADDSLPDGFPTDAVVDACIVVPAEERASRDPVELSCLHIGPAMVSAMVSVGGRPALHCRVLASSFEAFTPVRLESFGGELSGIITFGNVRFDRMYTFRGSIPFSESAVARPVVGRLRKFIQPGTGREATGDVGIVLPDGISMSIPEEHGHVSVVQFTASRDMRRIVLHPCLSGETPNDMSPPITSINGVRPDEYGRIAIVFAGDASEVPA